MGATLVLASRGQAPAVVSGRGAVAVDRARPRAVRGAEGGDVLGQFEHHVLTRQGDHPVHFHPVGRVYGPLVQDRFDTQDVTRAQGLEAAAFDIAPRRYHRRVFAVEGHAAVEVREVKTVQVAGEHPVLLIADLRVGQEVADMHRVIAEFNARGVVADKVRHLQHVARILVGCCGPPA